MEVSDLYELIPQWEDSREGLRCAQDYKECRIEVIGRREYDEEEEEGMTKEQLEFRQRPLDEEDITNIIGDYKESTLSIYELADRYELQINYLFRTLKENKIIEKETDVKNYAGFYEEHMGSGCEWDGKSELGMLD
jgi:ribosomal protein S25